MVSKSQLWTVFFCCCYCCCRLLVSLGFQLILFFIVELHFCCCCCCLFAFIVYLFVCFLRTFFFFSLFTLSFLFFFFLADSPLWFTLPVARFPPPPTSLYAVYGHSSLRTFFYWCVTFFFFSYFSSPGWIMKRETEFVKTLAFTLLLLFSYYSSLLLCLIPFLSQRNYRRGRDGESTENHLNPLFFFLSSFVYLTLLWFCGIHIEISWCVSTVWFASICFSLFLFVAEMWTRETLHNRILIRRTADMWILLFLFFFRLYY